MVTARLSPGGNGPSGNGSLLSSSSRSCSTSSCLLSEGSSYTCLHVVCTGVEGHVGGEEVGVVGRGGAGGGTWLDVPGKEPAELVDLLQCGGVYRIGLVSGS